MQELGIRNEKEENENVRKVYVPVVIDFSPSNNDLEVWISASEYELGLQALWEPW